MKVTYLSGPFLTEREEANGNSRIRWYNQFTLRGQPAEANGFRGERRCTVELLLTNLEIRALKETLEAEVSNLRMDIATTKDRKMREDLIMRKELLLSILEQIPTAVLDVA